MRLALIIYGSLEGHSGGYLYDRRLVEHLRAAGDTVEVISLPWRAYPRLLAHNFSRPLAQRLQALEVDLLLQDELNHPSLILPNRRWNAAGKPRIISIVHHLRSSELHPRLILPLYRAVERRYLETLGGFIFNSRTTQAAVQDLLGRPVTGVVAYPGGDQIGTGMPLEVIEQRLQRDPARPLRLLFVGSIIPRKGLHTLLKALRKLKRDNWTLEIVGGVGDKTYASQMLLLAAPLGEKVRFRGRVVDGDLRAIFETRDVLVMPSSYEGFGIVYLEGMACGLPPIATQVGAAREIIAAGTNGFLLPPEDANALAECIHSLVVDRTRLAELSRRARRRFDEFPTWEQSASATRAYLLSLL